MQLSEILNRATQIKGQTQQPRVQTADQAQTANRIPQNPLDRQANKTTVKGLAADRPNARALQSLKPQSRAQMLRQQAKTG